MKESTGDEPTLSLLLTRRSPPKRTETGEGKRDPPSLASARRTGGLGGGKAKNAETRLVMTMKNVNST